MKKKKEMEKRKNKSIKKKKKKIIEKKKKSRTIKTYARTTKTNFLKARTFEACSTFKHVLSAPNAQVSPDNSLHRHTQKKHTHKIHTYNNKVYKYTDIHINK